MPQGSKSTCTVYTYMIDWLTIKDDLVYHAYSCLVLIPQFINLFLRGSKLTIKRWTSVLFFCPIRCTLPIACASDAGFSSGSTRITCWASKRLRPLAPCWINNNNTWMKLDSGVPSGCFLFVFASLFCPLKWLMAVCAFLYIDKSWISAEYIIDIQNQDKTKESLENNIKSISPSSLVKYF